MNRLEQVFKNAGKPVLIPYVVAGDPDPVRSRELIRIIIDGGADILELGIPFSDPIADGPTLQRANERALRSGMNPDLLFELVRDVRMYSRIPIVLLVYANIVFRRGIGRFYHDASSAGIDGILIVDMPPEEALECVHEAKKYGISQIFLVSPTTTGERFGAILNHATGYLYVVSRLGVTGVRAELSDQVIHLLKRIRTMTDLPLAVGFGISSPDHIQPLYEAGADGIIVGSSLVKLIEDHLTEPDTLKFEIRTFLSVMRSAVEDKTTR